MVLANDGVTLSVLKQKTELRCFTLINGHMKCYLDRTRLYSEIPFHHLLIYRNFNNLVRDTHITRRTLPARIFRRIILINLIRERRIPSFAGERTSQGCLGHLAAEFDWNVAAEGHKRIYTSWLVLEHRSRSLLSLRARSVWKTGSVELDRGGIVASARTGCKKGATWTSS